MLISRVGQLSVDTKYRNQIPIVETETMVGSNCLRKWLIWEFGYGKSH